MYTEEITYDHLTKYKRHKEEQARRTQANLTEILHFPANPADVENFITLIPANEPYEDNRDLDQGQKEPMLPDKTTFSTVDLTQLLGAGSDLWLSPILSG